MKLGNFVSHIIISNFLIVTGKNKFSTEWGLATAVPYVGVPVISYSSLNTNLDLADSAALSAATFFTPCGDAAQSRLPAVGLLAHLKMLSSTEMFLTT